MAAAAAEAEQLVSLTTKKGPAGPVLTLRVSSTMGRNVVEFGKKHLFDGDDETCWSSHQGTPQWIALRLGKPARVARLDVQFQGGFVGQEVRLEGVVVDDLAAEDEVDSDDELPSGDADGWTLLGTMDPRDTSDPQAFELEAPAGQDGLPIVRLLRLTFGSSTDFYGRVVIYHLDFIGSLVSSSP